MSTLGWIHGLAAAAIGGAATATGGAVGAVIAGHSIFTREWWLTVGGAAAFGAFTAAVAYLKQSPLP